MAQVDITLVPGVITESGSADVSPVWLYLPVATTTESGRLGFPVGITLPPAVITEMGGLTRAPYLYVVDSGNNRVNAYDYDGNFKFSFGSFGSGNGQFNNPYAPATDGDFLYITDSGNNRIQKFTMFGVYVSQWGSYGTGDGEFDNPMGIAVDDHYVWMVDSGNNRWQVFTKDGVFRYALGEYGAGVNQFNAPTDCSVDSAYFYVLDAGNSRVVIYPKVIDNSGYGQGELPALTGSGSGYSDAGRGGGVLPAIALESPGATGGIKRAGSGQGVLPNLMGSGNGSVKHAGSGQGVLPALTGIGSGQLGSAGSGQGVLPAMLGAGTGRQTRVGSGQSVLPAIISTASGYIVLAAPEYQGVAVNMRNKAITEYSGLEFNSLAVMADGNVYGANADGIFKLSGADDNGVAISARFKTGRLDLHSEVVQRLVDIWLTGRLPGSGTFTVHEYDGDADDASEYPVVGEDEQMHDERVEIAQGHEGRFVALEFANVGGADFDLKGLTVKTQANRRRRR